MTSFEVIKYDLIKIEPNVVHEAVDFNEAEEFVHSLIAEPQNRECLYTINFGETILAAYRFISGQIICKRFATVSEVCASKTKTQLNWTSVST
jgi:hypothetical protein